MLLTINRATGGMLNLVSDETMVKVENITKIFKLLVWMFIFIFCLLLLMDWLLGPFIDYIPGVGRGSGDSAFIPVFFMWT